MTAPWGELAQPFTTDDIKERQGPKQHDGDCRKQYGRCQLQHRMLSYVDARAVMQRLDDVLTPGGWDFTSTVIPGTDIVRGELTIAGCTRVDYGYPNSDHDEEPVKAASSDALKRCAVMFGIGRHLYSDNTQSGGGRTPSPARQPARPVTAAYDAGGTAAAMRVITASVPEEPPDLFGDPEGEFLAIGGKNAPANIPTDSCPIHNEPWRGNPGDLYHGPKGVVPGGYCRHPDNVKKARGA